MRTKAGVECFTEGGVTQHALRSDVQADIKVKTEIPDTITMAFRQIYAEIRDYMGGGLETELRLKGKSGTMVLFGFLRGIDATHLVQDRPVFGPNSFSRMHGGYSEARMSTELSLDLMTNYGAWEEKQNEQKATEPKKSKEERTMLSKHIIADVTVGEINPITLELAIKKLAETNNKIQIVEKKDKMYLVVDGKDPIELNGEEFQSMVKKALAGKTIEAVKKNVGLSQLITSLNVIESITLVKAETNLEDIFK